MSQNYLDLLPIQEREFDTSRGTWKAKVINTVLRRHVGSVACKQGNVEGQSYQYARRADRSHDQGCAG